MYNIKEDGDAIFIDKDFKAVGLVEDIKNNLSCIFNTRKGEFFLDVDLGIDYTPLETKGSSDDAIRAVIMEGIAQEERITTIERIDIERFPIERQVKIFVEVKAGDLDIRMEEVL